MAVTLVGVQDRGQLLEPSTPTFKKYYHNKHNMKDLLEV